MYDRHMTGIHRHLQIAFATEAQVEFSEETAEIACGWPQKNNCWDIGKGRTKPVSSQLILRMTMKMIL